MELLETIPFTTNEIATDFLTAFPSFATGRWESTFTCENDIYTIEISPNYFFESAELSIKNTDGDYEVLNIPFNLAGNINYLLGFLSKYALYYNYKQQQFELWEL